MEQGRTVFMTLIAISVMLAFPPQAPTQPFPAPPASLSTRLLTPEATEAELRPSCDLCRKPDARAGSELRHHRFPPEKGLRPHKNAKGTHRSANQSLKSMLPHRPLAPQESLAQGVRNQNALMNS